MSTPDAVIVAETPAESVSAEKTANNSEQPVAAKPSPAQDLRDIQMLLVSGIFPGNVAPQVVKAYQLLDKMAATVELEVSKANETK